jgi:hypothetical protein
MASLVVLGLGSLLMPAVLESIKGGLKNALPAELKDKLGDDFIRECFSQANPLQYAKQHGLTPTVQYLQNSTRDFVAEQMAQKLHLSTDTIKGIIEPFITADLVQKYLPSAAAPSSEELPVVQNLDAGEECRVAILTEEKPALMKPQSIFDFVFMKQVLALVADHPPKPQSPAYSVKEMRDLSMAPCTTSEEALAQVQFNLIFSSVLLKADKPAPQPVPVLADQRVVIHEDYDFLTQPWDEKTQAFVADFEVVERKNDSEILSPAEEGFVDIPKETTGSTQPGDATQ